MPNRPVANRISRSSRTSIVADRLCGSVPITTCPTTLPPFIRTPLGSSAERATLLRAGQTPLEPLPASGTRRDRTPWTSHTNPPVGSREESVPSSTSTRAWPGPSRDTSIKKPRSGTTQLCRERVVAHPARRPVDPATGLGGRAIVGRRGRLWLDMLSKAIRRHADHLLEVDMLVARADCGGPARGCARSWGPSWVGAANRGAGGQAGCAARSVGHAGTGER